MHRQQAQLTRELLDAAQATGRQRQADNHRTVPVNLDKIIASVAGTATDGNRQCQTGLIVSEKGRKPGTTRRSACVSAPVSTARTAPTGSRSNASPPG